MEKFIESNKNEIQQMIEELVKEEGENVFIFLDPPYYSATKSALYGKNGNMHKSFDHIKFAETMRNCEHKWLITYDDSKYIRDLFSFANIIPWDLTYGMRNVTDGSDQKGKELFILKFNQMIQYINPNKNWHKSCKTIALNSFSPPPQPSLCSGRW